LPAFLDIQFLIFNYFIPKTVFASDCLEWKMHFDDLINFYYDERRPRQTFALKNAFRKIRQHLVGTCNEFKTFLYFKKLV
jgi:hypothetical protein